MKLFPYVDLVLRDFKSSLFEWCRFILRDDMLSLFLRRTNTPINYLVSLINTDQSSAVFHLKGFFFQHCWNIFKPAWSELNFSTLTQWKCKCFFLSQLLSSMAGGCFPALVNHLSACFFGCLDIVWAKWMLSAI